MSRVRDRLLRECMKPGAISGGSDIKDARVRELVYWFERLADDEANPKWMYEHAMELAYYCAEIKGI